MEERVLRTRNRGQILLHHTIPSTFLVAPAVAETRSVAGLTVSPIRSPSSALSCSQECFLASALEAHYE